MRVRKLQLLVCIALGASVTTAPAPASPSCSPDHTAAACVRPLNAEEQAALAAALVRLDASVECQALAAFVRENAGTARMLPYPIQTPYGLATGDAHVTEDPEGSGRVHVADSVWTRQGVLPRPMSAKVRTLLHDFAHLALELPQFTQYLSTDAADDALARCLPA